METNWLERTELLYGEKDMKKLNNAHVLVVGLGGVGSFAAEFLCRAGIGEMTIVDGDVVDITNINRQLIALTSTIGKPKTEVLAKRLLDINPNLKLNIKTEFLSPEGAFDIVDKKYTCVLDCIDSITPKTNLILSCLRNRVKIISAMGAGGKFDPSKVQVKNIFKTKQCHLSRTIRKRLKKAGFSKGIKVVFSEEQIKKESLKMTDGTNYKKSFYGTNSYMPALFGLYSATEAIKICLK